MMWENSLFIHGCAGRDSNKQFDITATRTEMKRMPMCTTLGRAHVGLFCG